MRAPSAAIFRSGEGVQRYTNSVPAALKKRPGRFKRPQIIVERESESIRAVPFLPSDDERLVKVEED